ncbi:B3 domain-containing protein/DUF724 domain-containing protein [Cephalotus follicularis]|uniref:B3 domain-containing protein/DUF724 domain-containing protein n=1 Tax=Cephalotus follicularis TaxID=3775 RepID=A0A1Q3C5S4_CEPFO|nr:B3 domain-containing protein/DUF724 domain-containing protein [Cephalotus follicularis]
MTVTPPEAMRGRPPANPEKLSRKKTSGDNQFTTRNDVFHNARESTGLKRKRVKLDDLHDDEAKSAVMERAEEIQANLAPEFPTMIKYMLPSHVSGGFWLGLPRQFCNKHLPKQDTMIFLEDESGHKYETKFLVEKTGLSGGWRGFSLDHNLLEGDVLVFHLVRATRFKVYIVRRNDSDDVDGALALMKLDTFIKGMKQDKVIEIWEKQSNDCELLMLDITQENTQKDSVMICDSKCGPILDHPENDSDGSEILDVIRLSDSVMEFKEVKSVEDFTILVNGLIINSELSKHLQTKYYELCCSQKSFLHDHLFEGLNCRLVSGMIAETINIADAIRASKLTTSQNDFITWEKTLKAFEDLGMNVGFLRARLYQLMNLPLKSKRHGEARIERTLAEEEMRTLKIKLLEVKERRNRLDAEIETMEASAGKLEVMFKEVANAPW